MGSVDIELLLKGFLIGISIAAPVGPIGVLCIKRTLAEGKLSGLCSGLGAATADAFYGMVAAFGLTAISNFLVGNQFWLRLIGGMFLCYLGIKTFLSKPAEEVAHLDSKGLLRNYTSTVFLTITNPMTIISFAAVFAGVGLVTNQSDYLSPFILVLGVFIGSGVWWLVLSTLVNLFRNRFNTKGLIWINWVSGLIILAFGLIALVSVVGVQLIL